MTSLLRRLVIPGRTLLVMGHDVSAGAMHTVPGLPRPRQLEGVPGAGSLTDGG